MIAVKAAFGSVQAFGPQINRNNRSFFSKYLCAIPAMVSYIGGGSVMTWSLRIWRVFHASGSGGAFSSSGTALSLSRARSLSRF